MLTFSEQVQGKTPDVQRRLYMLFRQAVRQGEVPALKLLTKFEIQGVKGQLRQVQDYAYTDDTVKQVLAWIEQQEQPQSQNGLTVEQVQKLSDEELSAAIQRQLKASKKRKVRTGKTAKKTMTAQSEQIPESTE